MIWLTCDDRAGVPQVVIPLWEDHYNFAQLAEDLGIGIYACRGTAPAWTVDCLVDAFGKGVLESREMSERGVVARRIADVSKHTKGTDVAAELIAELVVPQKS